MIKATYEISRSGRSNKELKVVVQRPNGTTKTIHFGSKGANTFPKHKDKKIKNAWIARHKVRENWGKSGVETAGFWAKHILWNKKSITSSIRDTAKTFGIKIKNMI